MFYYYQSGGGTERWKQVDARAAEKLSTTVKPAYITVLANDLVQNDDEVPDYSKVHYAGPFYIDWDTEDIEDAIASVNSFINLVVKEHDLSEDSLQFYATGGRGFHLEVPFDVFNYSKTKKAKYLPLIYKEMAFNLAVEGMDFRVYSMGKGRMWRCPNVDRGNGRYKVPVSVAEIRTMTAETYVEITSKQRFNFKFPTPEPSPLFGTLFSKCATKIQEANKGQGARHKGNKRLAEQFGGEYPPTVLSIMRGEGIRDDVGLNQIALQLATVSSALSVDEDEHVKKCAGLIEKHKGDSGRSKAQREWEVRRIFRYVDGNPCYSYKPEIIRNMLVEPETATDLSQVPQVAEGKESSTLIGDAVEVVPGQGTFSRTKDGDMILETNWAFTEETIAPVSDENGRLTGWVVTGTSGNSDASEMFFGASDFNTPDKLRDALSYDPRIVKTISSQRVSAGFHAKMLQGSGKPMRLTTKEGFILDKQGDTEKMVWSSPNPHDKAELSTNGYTFRSLSDNFNGVFKSDLTCAPELESNELTFKVIDALLNFNNSTKLCALMVGWFVSAFHRPIVASEALNYPMLLAFGLPGSGKTTMCRVMQGLFFYKEPIKTTVASVKSQYGIEAMLKNSTTIPVFIDEIKKESMTIERMAFINNIFHQCYEERTTALRGGGGQRGASVMTVVEETIEAPVIGIAEQIFGSAAIRDRTIHCRFRPEGKRGKEGAAQLLQENSEIISRLGAAIALATSRLNDITVFRTEYRSVKELVKNRLVNTESLNHRFVSNHTACVYGLKILHTVLKFTLNTDRFDERFNDLTEAILNMSDEDNHSVDPITVVLGKLAEMSHDKNEGPAKNYDYFIQTNEYIDIAVQACYSKLQKFEHGRGEKSIYKDYTAFYELLVDHPAVLDRNPLNSPLLEGFGRRVVVRLSLEALSQKGVASFKE